MKAISILSGGMDSTVALAKCFESGIEVKAAVNFWYGSKHNSIERRHAVVIASHYSIPIELIDLPFIASRFKSDLLQSGGEIPDGHYADPSMRKTVVPFRNGIMLSIAAGFAESLGVNALILGNHAGDHAIYPDCRPEFTSSMASAIRLGTYGQIELLTPFVNMTKTEIVQEGHLLKVPFNLTYSCYRGEELHCGRCGTCFERREAFELARIHDPTRYESV